MQKLFFGLFFMCTCFWASGQDLLTAAQLQAKKQDKLILLNFSGSDWCIPCIQLEKEYFKDSQFRRLADSQLVIIRADFPRKKKNMPAAAIVKQNEQLADRFNKNGSFPLTILLDANLRIVKTWDGRPEEEPAVFVRNLRNLLAHYKQP